MDNLNFLQRLAEIPFEEKAKTDVASPLLFWAYDLWDLNDAPETWRRVPIYTQSKCRDSLITWLWWKSTNSIRDCDFDWSARIS